MSKSFVLGALLACLACVAHGATVVARGTDIAFVNPSASGTGDVVALERVQFAAGPPCGQRLFSDIAIHEPRAGCGSQVLHLLTRDGRSLDPSVTADGAWVAWRTLDIDGVTTRFKVSRPDGTDLSEILASTCSQISDLEIAPTADYIAFKASGCAGSSATQIIRVQVAAPNTVDVVDSMPSADDLGLSRHHCVGAWGVVVYSKRVGAAHDLLKRLVGGPIVPIISATPEDEREVSIVTTGGTGYYFRRTSLSGIDNVRTASAIGTEAPLTNNTNPNWRIRSVSCSANGGAVVFESNGNLDPNANPDGSEEVFLSGSYLGAPWVLQVTDVPAPPPLTLPTVHRISGAAVIDTGDSVLVASRVVPMVSPCTAPDLNALALTNYQVWPADVSGRAIHGLPVIPSFTAILDPVQEVGSGCVLVPPLQDFATCRVAIFNSEESQRRFLVYSTLDNTSCPEIIDQAPSEVDVPAGERAFVTISYNSGCYDVIDGTVTIDIVSPDTGQADIAHVSWTF